MANDFYQHSGWPGTRALNASASWRSEFGLIEEGFDKLPDVSTANLFAVTDGSALVGKTAVQSKVILSLSNVPNLDTTAAVAHTPLTNNPHSVTATQVGLGNCENTSDLDKPISTLAQAALDLKAPLASPALTGAPTAPNAPATVYDQRVANMATAEAMVRHLMETYYFEGTGTTNGWRRFRNNLCLQWGTTLAPETAGAEHGTLFPVSFTAEPYAVLCTGRTNTATANSVWVTAAFATHFNARASLASQTYHWWAIGPLG